MPRTTLAMLLIGLLGAAVAEPAVADSGDPAGGAALGEVIIATAGAAVLTGLLALMGAAHRRGSIGFLTRAGDFAERRWALPGWAALPTVTTTLSLLVALLGMYWDIALHIGEGRDPGPLANPAHYLILGGLFGVFASGFLATVLPADRPGPAAVRITRGWYAPVGGLLLMACGGFALLGFPLDDFWHRLFGQDVTLWGPTHLMLIGGAALTLIGRSVLLVEGTHGRKMADDEVRARRETRVLALQRSMICGAFLIGLSTFQAEFDFGVPQFRLLFQPVLIALAAGIALTVARVWGGRGAALGAVALFLVIRGLVALTVGPGFGETTPHLPLYVAEAALVELVALRIGRERPLVLGAAAGALIGTVGLAAEWAWSHIWMPLPWPSELLPEAVVLGTVAGVAGGVIGGAIGAALAADAVPAPSRARVALPVAGVAIAAVFAFGLADRAPSGVSARVALQDVEPPPDRTVAARITIEPSGAAEDAEWLTVTSWQGDGLVVDRLRQVDADVYETTKPIPVHGEWKAVLRLHKGRVIGAAPIFLPEDRAIPAREVPAEAAFTRRLVSDKEVLQREAKQDVAGWVTTVAYLAILAIVLALIAALTWGLARLQRSIDPSEPRRSEPPAVGTDRSPAQPSGVLS